MNENYLWDKTENDPDIEKLENALQAFRYTETAAPALHAKIIPFKTESRRSFFRFGFALAACVILAVIGTGIWILNSDRNLNAVVTSAEVKAPQQNSALIIQPSIVENPHNTVAPRIQILTAKAIQTTHQTSKRSFLKARRTSPAVKLNTAPIINNSVPTETFATLTGEEKYAYDQLILALSITSSKLKIVKDKVDGLEKQNSVLSSGK